jgi:hypothetical protein
MDRPEHRSRHDGGTPPGWCVAEAARDRPGRLGSPAWAGVLAVLAGLLSGCGGGTTRPLSSGSPPTVAVAAPVATTATAASAGIPTSRASLQNLLVTPAVRDQLVHAYVTARGYQPGWIAGTEPGTVYYAHDHATGSYLAWAGFLAAAGAPQQVSVGLQDDGARTAFRRTQNSSWQTYNICATPQFFALVGGRLPTGATCPT